MMPLPCIIRALSTLIEVKRMNNNDFNSRKEEILRLQNQIISQLTKSKLETVGDDLFGNGGFPQTESGPPPGFPEVPKIDFTGKSQDEISDKSKPQSKDSGKAEKHEAALPKEDIAALRAELDSLIGLTGVKDEVESLINLVRVNQLRKEHELKVKDLSLHMVFSGNPGTGKTTVARIMSRIYHSLDILSKGHLVEVDRSGMVAGYVGQTALKTQEIIQKALGGVLFIDEAYALTTRGPQDYGQEAVETLLKAMEDHRDDLIVIVAGYIELMDEFVHSNPGLESRFNRFIHFPDYTVDELMDIFYLRCEKSAYVLAEGAKERLREIIKHESQNKIGFGNARGVRNLFEKSVSRQANRLARLQQINREQLMEIKAEDLEDANESGSVEETGQADD
ncbi:MAG: AAA family ATPase [Clostridiales bacterium]|nr:AAA family ATPase [Clostridiales bacterium]